MLKLATSAKMSGRIEPKVSILKRLGPPEAGCVDPRDRSDPQEQDQIDPQDRVDL